MKTLKFMPDLAAKILNGSKTTTWRLFDDKNLEKGDKLVLVNKETGEEFAQAEIVELWEKTLGEVGEKDFAGHETYKDKDDMLAHYRSYYGERVNLDSPLKIIRFKLIK